MRNRMLFITGLLALAAGVPAHVSAASVIAKTATGHVQPNQLELRLESQAPCDQTAAAIPNGSRLVSNQFMMRVDTNGVGVFGGPVRLVRPDGSLIFEARLHGVIGLGDGTASTDAPCRAPGRLDGWLDRQPAVFGSAALTRDVPEIRFTAEALDAAAGPVPLYKGALLGLLGEPTPPPSVTVTTDKREYAPSEVITFSVRNNGREGLSALNGRSYCTIIQMEHLGKSGWEPVGTCNSLLPMRPVPLPPGETVKAAIPAENSRAAGQYRGSVTVVRINADDSLQPLAVFYSPIFVVTGVRPTLLITPSRRSYGSRQPIVAIIRNGASPVRIMNGESFCGIVQLQRRVGDEWEKVAPCLTDRALTATDLKPGQIMEKMLPPANTVGPNWIPGRYRLAVRYQTLDAEGRPIGPEILAASEPFPVGNMMTPLTPARGR